MPTSPAGEVVVYFYPGRRHAGLHEGGVPVQRAAGRLRTPRRRGRRHLARRRRVAPALPRPLRPERAPAVRRRPLGHGPLRRVGREDPVRPHGRRGHPLDVPRRARRQARAGLVPRAAPTATRPRCSPRSRRKVARMPPEKPQWAELYTEVVTSGLCTGCAGCIVACPYDVLGYDDTNGRYRPFHVEDAGGPTDCTHGQRGCTLCTRACPRFRHLGAGDRHASSSADRVATDEVYGVAERRAARAGDRPGAPRRRPGRRASSRRSSSGRSSTTSSTRRSSPTSRATAATLEGGAGRGPHPRRGAAPRPAPATPTRPTRSPTPRRSRAGPSGSRSSG